MPLLSSSELRKMVDTGRRISRQMREEDKQKKLEQGVTEEQFDKEYNEYLQSFLDAHYKISGSYRHKKRKWSELSDQEKKESCTNATGKYRGIRKLPSGNTQPIPQNCNLCDACYKANSNGLKQRVAEVQENARKFMPDGKWHKKTVAKDTEAQSLKKKIGRNQNGRHIEIANPDNENEVDVWSLVDENEIGSDYGEPQEDGPAESTNFEAIYKTNRDSKKKLSFGKGLKSVSPASKKEKGEKIQIKYYDIIVADEGKYEEAQEIIYATNYIEKAKDAEHAKRLYTWQLKFILKELQLAKIGVAFIHEIYTNVDAAQLLADWNSNYQYWQMSINASLSLEGDEAKTDISRLYYSNNKKEKPEIAQ